MYVYKANKFQSLLYEKTQMQNVLLFRGPENSGLIFRDSTSGKQILFTFFIMVLAIFRWNNKHISSNTFFKPFKEDSYS